MRKKKKNEKTRTIVVLRLAVNTLASLSLPPSSLEHDESADIRSRQKLHRRETGNTFGRVGLDFNGVSF